MSSTSTCFEWLGAEKFGGLSSQLSGLGSRVSGRRECDSMMKPVKRRGAESGGGVSTVIVDM